MSFIAAPSMARRIVGRPYGNGACRKGPTDGERHRRPPVSLPWARGSLSASLNSCLVVWLTIAAHGSALLRREMLAELEAAEVGKSFLDAKSAISGIVAEGNWWCDQAATMDAEQDQSIAGVPSDFDCVYRRDPIGVVGLVTAWNYPINVAFRKVAPALIAGNCAILKPSEFACLSCMFLAQLADEAGIPPGEFSGCWEPYSSGPLILRAIGRVLADGLALLSHSATLHVRQVCSASSRAIAMPGLR